MTNSTAKRSPGAVNRGDVLTACFRDIATKSKVDSNGVCNYYDFIRREGLSLAIWFDIVEFRENIHMTVKIFANVHQLMFLVLKLVWIRKDRVDSLMFQNLLEPASNNTTR